MSQAVSAGIRAMNDVPEEAVEAAALELSAGDENAYMPEYRERARRVLTAVLRAALAPQPPATQAEDWAIEWHRLVETILTIIGLPPTLDYDEIASAVRSRFETVSAAPQPSERSGDTRDRGMSEWQPIETVPKGTLVLLFEPECRAGRGTLSARIVVERYPPSYPRESSHWMPLPPAPTSAKAD
jgi:hypothetical protein